MREDVAGALAGATSFAELEAFPWPTPDCLDRSQLPAQSARYAEHALLYGFADVWQRPALIRGWEGMFLDMVERPAWAHFLSRRFTDFYLEDYARAAEITGGRIDLYLVISDLQGRPLSVEWEDSGMDREHGAKEACEFVRRLEFSPAGRAFDAAFER